jgi:hypothetical protein
MIRRLCLVALVYVLLAVVLTWPLVRHLTDSIPGDPGDPLLNAWTLGWDADRLRHALHGIWDAPNFYPYHHTLAFSEHLLGIVVFVAPLVWTTGNPLVAYNVAFILSFALAAFGMFVLTRELTGRDDAAWVAGLIFGFMPARLGQIGHLQVLMSGWLPLALWALHRFAKRTDALSLGAFVAFTLLQGLSNNYFIYFLALPVAIVAGHAFVTASSAQRTSIVLGLGVAAVIVVGALLPIAIVYFTVRHQFGMTRSIGEAAAFGADLGAYLHGNDAVRTPLLVWPHLPFVANPGGPESALWIGVAGLLLTAVGLSVAFRWSASEWRSIARVYALIGAAALILSLGADPAAWRIRLPFGALYRALFAIVPGLNGIRVPARLSVVVDLAVGVLSALGLAVLVRSLSHTAAWTAAVAVGGVVLLEGAVVPFPLAFVGRGGQPDRSAYNWIRDHPAGPIIELPIGETAPPLQSFGYQYQTLFHRQPIVNGASGYDSALAAFLGGAGSPLAEPSQISDAVRLLRSIGVRMVVVHPQAYMNADVARMIVTVLDSDRQSTKHDKVGGVDVFTLAAFPDRERPERQAHRDLTQADALHQISSRAITATSNTSAAMLPLAFDENSETRWTTDAIQRGGEWIDLALDKPHDVVRVRLAGPLTGDYPRGLLVQVDEGNGEWRTLYDGSALVQLGQGLIREPTSTPIDIWLPVNHAHRLRLTQIGSAERFWSIPELSLWIF